MAKRGRPPLDPDGSAELRVRVPQADVRYLEELARARGLVDVDERPILAAAVRLVIDEHRRNDATPG